MAAPTPARRVITHTLAPCLAFVLGLAAFAVGRPAAASDPDALWHIVHDLCEPNMRAAADPTPCLSVDLSGGYVVMKDIQGRTQLLVIPTDRVAGIESPALLDPAAPNYWQDAWGARRLFEQKAGRPVPRQDIALAVNSAHGRTQNQLHIHVDCVRPDVQAALAANLERIGRRWTFFPFDLAGHRYRVRRLDGEELGAHDPFKLLADGDAEARADMGAETLAVVGEVFAHDRPGFVVLSDRAGAEPGDAASAEDLLDHGCAVLGPPGPAAAKSLSAGEPG